MYMTHNLTACCM